MQPNHYDQGGFSVRHILKAFCPKNMPPHQVALWWNIGRYILRCGFKHPDPEADLKKAAEYLEWLIHDGTTCIKHFTWALRGLLARTREIYQASPEQLELIQELQRELTSLQERTQCPTEINASTPEPYIDEL